MPTDAQRRAQDKWDRENMAHINCKMRREIAEEFKAAAKANGTTPNAASPASTAERMAMSASCLAARSEMATSSRCSAAAMSSAMVIGDPFWL